MSKEKMQVVPCNMPVSIVKQIDEAVKNSGAVNRSEVIRNILYDFFNPEAG